MIVIAGVGGIGLVVGVVVGFFAFRRISTWCPQCGAAARCPCCPDHPTPNEARRARAAAPAQRRPAAGLPTATRHPAAGPARASATGRHAGLRWLTGRPS